MPGFDDTSKSDSDLLRMIADFLHTEYQKGKKVNGILYFHRISDPRVGGTFKRNFTMFKKLCGEDVFENVAIITTRWDQATEIVGNERLAELKTKPRLFKKVIDSGGEIFKHDCTKESGGRVIRWLINKSPKPLLIQNELAGGKSVLELTAGQELQKDIMEQAKKHEKEMVALQEEKEKIQDETGLQELEEECRALREKMAHLQAESEKLAETTERSLPTPSDSSPSSRPVKAQRDRKVTNIEGKTTGELAAEIIEIRRALERLQVESKAEKELREKWCEDKEREFKALHDRLERERKRRKELEERMTRVLGNPPNNREPAHRYRRDEKPLVAKAITEDSHYYRL